MAGSNTDHRSISECDDDDTSLVEDEVCSELEMIDEPHPLVDSVESKSASDKKRTQIEYIQQRQKRTSAFRKRKTGLMKKGYELGKLTGAEVLVVVVRDEMMFTYGTPKLRGLPQMAPGRELLRQCIQSSQALEPLIASSRLEDKSDVSDVDQWEHCHEQKQELPVSRQSSASSDCVQVGSSPMSSLQNDLRRTVSEPAYTNAARQAYGNTSNMLRQQTGHASLFSGSSPYMSHEELHATNSMPVPSLQPTNSMLAPSLLENHIPVNQYCTVDNQQGMSQPGMSQPSLNQPGLNQPGLNQPGLNQPGLNQPGLNQQSMSQPGMSQQAMSHPTLSMKLSAHSLASYPAAGAGNLPPLSNGHGHVLATNGTGLMQADQFFGLQTTRSVTQEPAYSFSSPDVRSSSGQFFRPSCEPLVYTGPTLDTVPNPGAQYDGDRAMSSQAGHHDGYTLMPVSA